MNWSLFALASLTTYRLALMLSSEEGPAAMFAKMRGLVPAKTNPGRGVRCIYCWSVWIGWIITCILVMRGDVPGKDYVFYAFSLSAVAIALHQTFTKN